MNKCLVFALIAMTSINVVVTSTTTNPEPICIPWLGKCLLTEQCCRDLVCMRYLAKCIPGQIWNDNRPIGDGPFPPKIKTLFN
ncbi:hypothetical protein EAG_09772 [Camponotus floridanus]|uniref:Uncharacterized protein n=1 Tax=Camponotus floridanus TaxID=104421 RepID=E2AMT8_CAMFO|nr:uncharacterized protein LOC105254151 [Camponotus floridanus]EFN65252.1 hypothetical protein EAG_09772 [Camponotus floridanus]